MEDYYERVREDVLGYIPVGVKRMLDVGCGTGVTTRAIARAADVEWAGGVELFPSAAAEARQHLDRVWEGDLESVRPEDEIPAGSLDLILFLDILEHLVDPWSVVQRFTPLLKPGGQIIVSVPNIRNIKFIRKLLFKGDFNYTDAGLLDRTHLRFFTRDTAEALACAGGAKLVGSHNANRYGPMEVRRWLVALSGGKLDNVLAKQWIVVVEC